MSEPSTGTIIILALLIVASPLLLVAIAWWLRLFMSAWIVLVRRLLGRGDKSKDYDDEVMDLVHAKTDFGKMKRQFDEKAALVSKRLEERRRKAL